MIRHLIRRPISVLMAVLAATILGCVCYISLPTSMLPRVAIPKVFIEVEGENMSAMELETQRMQPLRRSVMQIKGLEEMRSETRNGRGYIYLTFSFGTDTELASLEVNENIERVLSTMPKDAVRPKVVKASTTDIPVFYLSMTLKEDDGNNEKFLDLSELADNVIRRRLEQLPQVAMVDMTGGEKEMIRVVPDANKMQTLGITPAEIEKALQEVNTLPGSMTVRDGYYEYSIRVSSLLRGVDDIANVYLQHGDRLLQLHDICQISRVSQTAKGYSYVNGKKAITLAVIKQSEEKTDQLRKEVDETISHFRKIYPGVEFNVNRNQTELLDFTISNLEQNFLQGFLLVLIVTLLFIGDLRSSLIIGITMVVSVVTTFLLFDLCKVSLNIVSLSGLILAVGMMIDNAIVLTENITQHLERGKLFNRGIADATTEMLSPLFSSSLTTVAIFVPLVFLSGIAGALFFDQAFSVTASLTVSYIVAVVLLPVLYLLLGGRHSQTHSALMRLATRLTEGCKSIYSKGTDAVFRHKLPAVVLALMTIPLCAFLFVSMPKERLPLVDQHELEMTIDWNEEISLEENRQRTMELLRSMQRFGEEDVASIGLQDYMLSQGQTHSVTECALYFNTKSANALTVLQDSLHAFMSRHHPEAVVSYAPPTTAIEQMFGMQGSELELQLSSKQAGGMLTVEQVEHFREKLEKVLGRPLPPVPVQSQLLLRLDREKMAIYHVRYASVDSVLERNLQFNTVTTLANEQGAIPISIGSEQQTLQQVLKNSFVPSAKNGMIPLSAFVSVENAQTFKQIVAGRDGAYFPLNIDKTGDVEAVVDKVKQAVSDDDALQVSFAGSWFSNQKMMTELMLIMLVSLLLMYFILCAQFESFVQPLVILAEIPIDVFFALLVLMLTGNSLNLMSAIGIIVSCGVVINDSILKIDSINVLRKQGVPLLDAIHQAGRQRVRAILMTSLTTVLAMIPSLYAFDIGSELQKPLIIAMSAAMIFGTAVSLYIVPLFYYLIYRHGSKKN